MKQHTIKKEIKEEIGRVYENLPDEFYAWTLFQKVVRYIAAIHQRHIYSDTVLRYFREMRQDGEIECECLCRQKSLYSKNITT